MNTELKKRIQFIINLETYELITCFLGIIIMKIIAVSTNSYEYSSLANVTHGS